MIKRPSEATQLKNAKRELRELSRRFNTLQMELTHYRVRATKAETDAADWRARFDRLLSREPKPAPIFQPFSQQAPMAADCGCPTDRVCSNTACPRRTITVTCTGASDQSSGVRHD